MDNTEILVAAISDPEYKNRLSLLRQEMDKLDEQQKDLEAQIAKNTALVQEARDLKAAADAKAAAVDKQHAEVTASFRQLADAQAAHEAAKQSFLKGQQAAETSMRQRDVALVGRQRQVDDLAAAATVKHAQLSQREAAVAALEAKYNAAREHAQRFLDAVA